MSELQGHGSILLERQVDLPGAAVRAGSQQRLNDILAGVLVAVVALAPIPLGSNRPFFWAMWAATVGGTAAIYLLLLLLRGEPLRFAPTRLWAPALLILGLAGFLVMQMLPVWPAGVSFPTARGDTIIAGTLSLAPGSTWHVLLQLGTYVLFFLLALQVAVNRARARTLALTILAVVAAHAAYGLVALTMLGDPLLFFEKWAYEGYATGTFVNRNSFATLLAFGAVLGTIVSLREISSGTRPGLRPGPALVYVAQTGLIAAALLATGSRMGLIAALLGVAVAVLVSLRKWLPQKGATRWLALAALPVFGTAAVLVLYGGATLERLGSFESDAGVRGELYAQVLTMIAARPWLGYGAGAFEVAYPLFHQLPVSADLVWDKAHSTYLSLWSELGLIAGSIPLILFAMIAWLALRLALKRRADWAAPAIALGVIVAGGVHSLVDFSLEIEANVFLLLALLAIGVARPEEADRAG